MTTTVLHTRDGRLDAAAEAAFADLARRLSDGDDPLLVHIHGGLVDQAAAEAIAARLSGSGNQSFNAPAQWEQLYVVWRTGLLETIGTNWRELHQRDRLYRALLGKLLEFFARRIVGGGRGGGEEAIDRGEIERRLSEPEQTPFADLDAEAATGDPTLLALNLTEGDLAGQLGASLNRDSQLIGAAQDIDAAARPPGGRAPLSGDSAVGSEMLRRLDEDPEKELRAEASGVGGRGMSAGVLTSLVRHGVEVGKRVRRRIKSGRDHGLHATIVEEVLRELYGDFIGGRVWGMMRDDAGQHFDDGGAGRRLIDALAAGPKRRVVLVGHSAGSIMISRLLLDLAARDVPLEVDVVLLAPAVRSRLFAEALAAARDRVGRFRMFALSDAVERADAVLGPNTGFLYPSSLLFLVSGLFERDDAEPLEDAPLLGMQRFRAWKSGSIGVAEDGWASKIAQFLTSIEHAEVYAPATGAGIGSNATSHGGMDDDPPTLASVSTLFA